MTRAGLRTRGPVLAIVAAATALYTAHGVLRYAAFHSPAYDLGFFDQLTANLSAGRGWSSSFIGYDFRGEHWEPILLAWSLLYRLVQTPLWLVVINSVALGVAPWAAWRLARAWLGDGHPAALVAAVATALSPLVLTTAAFDYHSEALTPVLALLALDAAHRRRWLAFAACCAVLLLLKEDAFLVVAGIGWVVWRVERTRAGLLVAVAAVAGFVLVVGVFMPALRGGGGSDLLARYGYLAAGGHATGPGEVLAGMVTHPGTWAAHLVSGPALAGLALALLPLALLPLLSGWALLAVVPVLAVALLSGDADQAGLHFQYGAESFPLLLACALLGWRRAEALAIRVRGDAAHAYSRRVVAVVALVAAALAVPLAVDVGARVADVDGLDRSSAVAAVLHAVPDGAAVAASTGLVAHLSDRAVVTEVPDLRGARWVVVDSVVAPSTQALDAGYAATVAQLSASFHMVASAAGVTVWERT